MSKSGFGQMYRRLSSKLLDLVVTPHVLGEVPTEPVSTTETEAKTERQKVVCYVLQNHSRSNALVVDGETRRLNLKPARSISHRYSSGKSFSFIFTTQ